MSGRMTALQQIAESALTRVVRGALFYCLLVAQLGLAGTAQAGERVEIRKVVDGDTVVLTSGKTVRLIGINTPEKAGSRGPAQPLSSHASQRLEAMLANADIKLVAGQDRYDRYGRTLAHLQTGSGKLIQTQLLREGLAWVVAIPPNTEQLDLFIEAENQARKAKRGIWSVNAYQPVAAPEVGDRLGFQLVHGTIERSWAGKNQHYFALRHGEKKAELVLIVPYKHWPHFGAEPQSLVGRRIEARGWLGRHPRYGLRLYITHPFMMGLI
jgi:endonuclease YncB( thermonuclease family)